MKPEQTQRAVSSHHYMRVVVSMRVFFTTHSRFYRHGRTQAKNGCMMPILALLSTRETTCQKTHVVIVAKVSLPAVEQSHVTSVSSGQTTNVLQFFSVEHTTSYAAAVIYSISCAIDALFTSMLSSHPPIC